jgi:hypothetical protein
MMMLNNAVLESVVRAEIVKLLNITNTSARMHINAHRLRVLRSHSLSHIGARNPHVLAYAAAYLRAHKIINIFVRGIILRIVEFIRIKILLIFSKI